MAKRSTLPAELREIVQEVGEKVTSEDVDLYRKLQLATNESFRDKAILEAWAKQQNQKNGLRQRVAWCLMVAMAIQAIAINVFFALIGLGWLNYEQWVASTFIGAVFAEFAALVTVMVRYLFPADSTPVGDLKKTMELIKDVD